MLSSLPIRLGPEPKNFVMPEYPATPPEPAVLPPPPTTVTKRPRTTYIPLFLRYKLECSQKLPFMMCLIVPVDLACVPLYAYVYTNI